MKKLFQKKIFKYFLILLVLGFIFGVVFIFFIKDLDKFTIKSGLNEYIKLLSSKNYSYFDGFINSLKNNLIYTSLIWACGIIFILVPILVFIIFYKGFMIGFMLSSFILTFKAKGILYFILFIFPHELINIFSILLFSMYAIKFSKKIAGSIYRNEDINLRKVLFNYMIIFGVFILIAIISALIEIYLNSFILKLLI
jgi:stage II sporulation protein M